MSVCLLCGKPSQKKREKADLICTHLICKDCFKVAPNAEAQRRGLNPCQICRGEEPTLIVRIPKYKIFSPTKLCQKRVGFSPITSLQDKLK